MRQNYNFIGIQYDKLHTFLNIKKAANNLIIYALHQQKLI